MDSEKKKRTGILLRCCICIGGAIGIAINSMGIFFYPLSEGLSLPIGRVSFMATLLSLGTGFFAPVFERLIRRHPIAKVMSSGVLLTVFAYVLLAFASNAIMLYIGASLAGIGTACFAAYPVTMILHSWYGEKDGTASGFALSFSGITGAFMNPLFSWLITRFGTKAAFLTAAVLYLIIVFPATRGMELKQETQKKETQKVQGRKTPMLIVVLLFIACVAYQMEAALNSHLSSIGVEAGHTLSFSSLMMTSCMIANVLFKLFHGWLADRLDGIRASAIMNLFGIAGMLCLLNGSSDFLLLAGSFLYASFCSLSTLGLSQVCECATNSDYAQIYAGVITAGNASFAIAVSIYGLIHDATGDYHASMLTVLAIAITALVSTILLGILKRKEQKKYESESE